MKKNKFNYLLVIQQFYGTNWEDVSEYQATSTGKPIEKSDKFRTLKSGTKIPISLYSHDLTEYKFMGYPTRTIFRKELNTIIN